jgi:hypothetical protein
MTSNSMERSSIQPFGRETCGAATHKHFKGRVDNVLLACSNLRDLVDQPSTHLPNIIDVLSKEVKNS